MARRGIRRTLIAVGLLIALALVLLVAGILLVRSSFPRTRGTIQLDGLQAPVQVLRDARGVPNIYAANMHDLFFAQGYVHAQDRFWQMDFWRHIGSGRLAEMFGESQLETDTFLRTLGWARVVEQELAALDADTLAILDAYAEGVNAYLAEHRGAGLSLEYAVLGLLTPGYTPEPWTPLHSLTWAKAMAYDLGGNMDQELERAVLLRTLGPTRLADLFPGYPADNPVIVSGAYASPADGSTRCWMATWRASARTTGSSRAAAPRPARRSWRTTCTLVCAFRPSGTKTDCTARRSGPRARSRWWATRSPVCPAWSSGTTATLRGV
jgi:acyl-homoserine lactone acylase PvdQ